MPETNNNEKKRFGRRAACGFIIVALTTVAFYVCVFRGFDISWFAEYTRTMLFILGFVMGGLTITDTVKEWRK